MSVRRHPKWTRDWAVMPGEVIKEWLAEKGMTQLALAEKMGVAPSYISDVIRGGRGVSAHLALRLEKATGISPDVLVRMQADYDLAVARQEAVS